VNEAARRGEINFDRVAAEYDATRGGVDRARAAARDVAGHLPTGDVLEIGVGTGIVAAALLGEAPQARRLVGVDISGEMLKRAQRRLPGSVLRASAQRVPFSDGQFHGVVAVHVLHVVSDITATLAEAARVLRPGGRVVAIHGEPQHPDDELSDATRGLKAARSHRSDTPEAVRSAAHEAGLRCVEQHPTSPRTAQHSPAELADLIDRRSWSNLWALDDVEWQTHVAPVIEALRALPDQHRPRVQEARLTLTVLEHT
jgi:ubiquinone/menaquinone biosynthesis C-methylase UbiE